VMAAVADGSLTGVCHSISYPDRDGVEA
jgi:hypothetical protein